MSYQLEIRNDTAANWTSSNPILAQAELGYENDTFKIKVGDGATAWTSLSYSTWYTLPVATTTVLGGVKVDGSTITITDDVISAVSGSTSLADLTDVEESDPSNGQALVYNSGASKWENSTLDFDVSGAAATAQSAAEAASLPVGTTLSTTTPLTGGGDLSSGLTIAVSDATTSVVGVVKPDGTTILISSGVISVPTATDSVLGVVKPDGTSITISAGVISSAGISASNLVNPETPSGTVDGTNVTFALAYTPVANSLSLYCNGFFQDNSDVGDYTYSGTTITFNVAPLSGSKIRATYIKS